MPAIYGARAASAGHGGHEKRGILRLTSRTSREQLATKFREPQSQRTTSGREYSFILLRLFVLFVASEKAVHDFRRGRLR